MLIIQLSAVLRKISIFMPVSFLCFSAAAACGEMQVSLKSVSRTDELKTVQVSHCISR